MFQDRNKIVGDSAACTDAMPRCIWLGCDILEVWLTVNNYLVRNCFDHDPVEYQLNTYWLS